MIELSTRIEGLFSGKSVKPILDKLNITQATYYRSIKTHNWKLEHVVNIADYFNVSLDWLIKGKDGNAEIEQWKNTAKTFQKSLLELLKEKEYEEERIQS